MKNRLIQFGLSVALLGLLIQIVLIAPSQIRDSEEKAAKMPAPVTQEDKTSRDNTADQSMNGMHMIETQEGRKEWELWSDKATSLKAKETVLLDKVKAVIFAESGVTFTVTGKEGNVQVKTKNLRVEGDVVTRSSNGYTFKTESMEYESKTRTMTAANDVEMFGPPDPQGHVLHLRGVGMRASLIKNTMEILSDVHAEKPLENNHTAYIKSRRSVFSSKDRTAVFLENVVIDLESMRITGPVATFNYDGKSDQVKSVFVSGGTRVSDTDKWATAENVLVDFAEEKFTFRGDPRVVQNNDELRGEEIIFLDGGKQVQVQRARAKVDEQRMEKKN